MGQEIAEKTWQNEVIGWEQFSTDVLMKNGVIDGILLISSNSKLVYEKGKLADIRKDGLAQFTHLFEYTGEDEGLQVFLNGITLKFLDTEKNEAQTIKYTIIRKSLHSLHAISKMNQFGLIIISLPYGILIGSHCHPVTSIMASSYLENAAELLRK